jgi:DNA mismatch repair ATPase MutL
MAEQNQQAPKPSEKKKSKRIQDNKPLLAIVILVTLIMLSAIGVGTYALIDSIANKDDDNTEETSNEEDSEDTTADESTDESTDDADDESTDEDSDVVADSSSEDNSSEDTSSDEEDSSNEEDSSEDSEEDSSSDDSSNEDTDNEDESTDEETDNEDESSDSEDDGEVNANGAVSTASAGAGLSVAGKAKSDANQTKIASTGVWSATDYVHGDVVDKMYTVQLGDTLWEISEGFYGDAFQYPRIQTENSPKIGYLPDGSQALIIPGQVLVLP